MYACIYASYAYACAYKVSRGWPGSLGDHSQTSIGWSTKFGAEREHSDVCLFPTQKSMCIWWATPRNLPQPKPWVGSSQWPPLPSTTGGRRPPENRGAAADDVPQDGGATRTPPPGPPAGPRHPHPLLHPTAAGDPGWATVSRQPGQPLAVSVSTYSIFHFLFADHRTLPWPTSSGHPLGVVGRAGLGTHSPRQETAACGQLPIGPRVALPVYPPPPLPPRIVRHCVWCRDSMPINPPPSG